MKLPTFWNPLKSFAVLIVLSVVASKDLQSTETGENHFSSTKRSPELHTQEKQLDAALNPMGTLSLDMASIAMFGIMGLPILGAINLLVPLMSAGARTSPSKRQTGIPNSVRSKSDSFTRSLRKKRDLPYAKDLLDLLIAVENALERYGITDPQCQLRATCEIHRRGVNDINSRFAENFIRLVRRMRTEIRNPRVVPLAKYVYEYYEEAAIRGETNCDCGQLYDRCPHSIDYFMKRKKGSRLLW